MSSPVNPTRTRKPAVADDTDRTLSPDDGLGALVRKTLRVSLGRAEPSPDVWDRIRDKIDPTTVDAR